MAVRRQVNQAKVYGVYSMMSHTTDVCTHVQQGVMSDLYSNTYNPG